MSNTDSHLGEELTLLAVALGIYLVRAFDKTTATLIAQFFNNTGATMVTILVQNALLLIPENNPSSAQLEEHREQK